MGVRVNDVHSITCAYDRQDSRSPVRCGRSPSRHYTDDLNEYRSHRPGRHGCGDRKLSVGTTVPAVIVADVLALVVLP